MITRHHQSSQMSLVSSTNMSLIISLTMPASNALAHPTLSDVTRRWCLTNYGWHRWLSWPVIYERSLKHLQRTYILVIEHLQLTLLSGLWSVGEAWSTYRESSVWKVAIGLISNLWLKHVNNVILPLQVL